MKKTLIYISIIFFFNSLLRLHGQDTSIIPSTIKKAVYFDVTPPLREMNLIEPVKEKSHDDEIPNKLYREDFNHPPPQIFRFAEDPVWQKQNGIYGPNMTSPVQNFEGINNISGVYPPDTQGDVGLNHYVQVVNSNFKIWNKYGVSLLGPVSLSTIWAGIPAPWDGTNDGDPVVLYDQAAGRWLISQFLRH
jgi:hypothetical protein